MKSFGIAVKREPLGAMAIIVALIPFLFDVSKDYLFNGPSLKISCRTPVDTDFKHEDGFLYYQTRCLIANQSRDPVSVTYLDPVMLHGDYPYSLIGRRNMNPTLEAPYSSKLGGHYTKMVSEFPANLNSRASIAIDAVFFTSVGDMSSNKKVQACSMNLEFDRLSDVKICIGQRSKLDTKGATEELQQTTTAKEQIYQGYDYGLASYDGFGLEIGLGSGIRYIVEADLTAVKGFRCNEEIRQLNCHSFGTDRSKVINIGVEPDYSAFNLRSFLFLGALSVVLMLILQLTFFGGRMIVRSIRNYIKKNQKNDADLPSDLTAVNASSVSDVKQPTKEQDV